MRIGVKMLIGLVRPYRWHVVLSLVFAFMSAAAFGVNLLAVFPVVNSVFFSAHTGGSASLLSGAFPFDLGLKNIPVPIQTLGMYSATLILNALLVYVLQCVNSSLTEKLTTDCRVSVLRAVNNLSYRDFQARDRGEYVQLLITETRSVYAVFKQLLNVVQTVLNSVVCFSILMLLSVRMMLLSFLCMACVAMSGMVLTRLIKRKSTFALSERANFSSVVVDVVSGAKQLKIFNAGDAAVELLFQASRRSESIARGVANLSALHPLVTSFMLVLSFFGAVSFALYWPGVFGEKDPHASLITFVIILTRVLAPLGQFSKEFGTLHANLPAVVRVAEFVSRSHDCDVHEGTVRFSSDVSGSIEFRDVTFGYDAETPVLKAVSLVIAQGDYVGLMGPSGAGKSTLFSLLLGLAEPQAGRILWNGVDVKDVDKGVLRQRMSLLPQDFYLFRGSVRQNMHMACPDAGEERIWDALDRAGMLDYVKALPDKLDSPLGSDGELLSGGQRQRLGLACVLLRDADVILLDEGLSAVDAATEAFILERLKELNMQGKTIVSSSHKRETVRDANRLFEVEGGSVREVGGKSAEGCHAGDA